MKWGHTTDTYSTKQISEEIVRLARRMRRIHSRQDGHVSRLDRLRVLLLQRDAQSQRDLAHLLDIRPPSLSEGLDKLEEDGEVTRERDREDRRKVRVLLTEKGRELAEAAKDRASQSSGIFEGCLTSDEARTFIDLCKRLHAHIDQMDRGEEECQTSHRHGHNRGGRHHHPEHRRSGPRGTGPDVEEGGTGQPRGSREEGSRGRI